VITEIKRTKIFI